MFLNAIISTLSYIFDNLFHAIFSLSILACVKHNEPLNQ